MPNSNRRLIETLLDAEQDVNDATYQAATLTDRFGQARQPPIERVRGRIEDAENSLDQAKIILDTMEGEIPDEIDDEGMKQ